MDDTLVTVGQGHSRCKLPQRQRHGHRPSLILFGASPACWMITTEVLCRVS